MSIFKQAIVNNPSTEYYGEGVEHFYDFVRPNIKIPRLISTLVENEFIEVKKPKARHCIAMLLTNLAKHAPVAYSRHTDFYTDYKIDYYTYTFVIAAVKAVYEHGYAFSRAGGKNRKYDTGISSRLHPFDKFYDLDSTFKVELDFKTIPLIQVDKKQIFNLCDLKEYVTKPYTKAIINTLNSPSTNSITTSHNGMIYTQIFSESETLNRKYFNRIVLDFKQLPKLRFEPPNQVCLTRIFNNDECGRWYQKGGLSYQHLSEKERLKVLLNGQEVEELDYSAMHPNILYVWEGQQCPVSFYEQIAIQLGVSYTETKFVIKKVALMSINASDEKDLAKAIRGDWYSEMKANYTRIKEGREPRKILLDELNRLNIDFKQIVIAFRKAHPTVEKYIYYASANKLMLAESNIMTLVLLDLMNKNIPAIPIHDSVLFQKQDANASTVKQVMLDQYKQYTGFTINVK